MAIIDALAQQMARAVLAGDEASALALLDLLTERREGRKDQQALYIIDLGDYERGSVCLAPASLGVEDVTRWVDPLGCGNALVAMALPLWMNDEHCVMRPLWKEGLVTLRGESCLRSIPTSILRYLLEVPTPQQLRSMDWLPADRPNATNLIIAELERRAREEG